MGRYLSTQAAGSKETSEIPETPFLALVHIAVEAETAESGGPFSIGASTRVEQRAGDAVDSPALADFLERALYRSLREIPSGRRSRMAGFAK